MFPIVLCNTSSSEQSFCTGFGILRDHLNAVILKKNYAMFLSNNNSREKCIIKLVLTAILPQLSKMSGNAIVT